MMNGERVLLGLRPGCRPGDAVAEAARHERASLIFEETTQTFPQTVELGLDLSELLDQAECVFPRQRLDAGSEHDQASSQDLKLVATIHALLTLSNMRSRTPGRRPRSQPAKCR